MDSIRIESDGTLSGTKVFGPDGEQMKGIKKIEIEPIDGAERAEDVKATLTFLDPELRMDVDIEKTVAKIEEGTA